jgi:hypothetical protein
MTELIEHGELYCAGIIAHEVGHARISRYLDILKEGLFHRGMAGLLNVLEDGRSDTWMCRRYRGVRSWLEVVSEEFEAVAIEPATRFLALMKTFLADAEGDFKKVEFGFPDIEIAEIFHTTRAARKAYRDELPGMFATEDEVHASAQRAFDIAERHIAPRVLRLWDEASEDNEALTRGTGRVLVPTSETLRNFGGMPSTQKFTLGTYLHHRLQVSHHVDRLVAELDDILIARRRGVWSRGHASGIRVDLRTVMSNEANPERFRAPFLRRTIPDRRSVAFGLLIDLSGSMSEDGKIEAALDALVLLSEVLERLEVPFRIDGFQNVLMPIIDFDHGIDDAFRERISRLAEETRYIRHGARNSPNYNDDGPCLERAAELLLRYPSDDHVLIVLSDGLPNGERSGEEDLHRAVKKAERSGIHLIGLGVGPETEHVAKFYRNHLAEVPAPELAFRLGEVVKATIEGGVGG